MGAPSAQASAPCAPTPKTGSTGVITASAWRNEQRHADQHHARRSDLVARSPGQHERGDQHGDEHDESEDGQRQQEAIEVDPARALDVRPRRGGDRRVVAGPAEPRWQGEHR